MSRCTSHLTKRLALNLLGLKLDGDIAVNSERSSRNLEPPARTQKYTEHAFLDQVDSNVDAGRERQKRRW
jgi:hypothetical protein